MNGMIYIPFLLLVLSFPLSSSADTWAKKYLDYHDNSSIKAIINSDDGGYVLAGSAPPQQGRHDNDALVVKVDANGNIIWQKQYDDADDFTSAFAAAIAQTPDGGFIVTGYRGSGIYEPGSGDARFWVLKLDSLGSLQWQRSLHRMSYDRRSPAGVIMSHDGGYLLNDSRYIIKLDVNGNIQWQKVCGATYCWINSIKSVPDGYIAVGSGYLGESGGALIMKLDTGGNLLWQKLYSTNMAAGYDANVVQLTRDGGFIVGGSKNERGGPYARAIDAWLLKLDGSGNIQWQQAYDYLRGYASGVSSIVTSPDGGYGVSFSNFLFKTNSHGVIQWQIKIDSAIYGLQGLSITSEGAYMIASSDAVIKLGIDVDIQGCANVARLGGAIQPSDAGAIEMSMSVPLFNATIPSDTNSASVTESNLAVSGYCDERIMQAPKGQTVINPQFIGYPVLSPEPAGASPLGLGVNPNVFNPQIGLLKFSEPVDIYFAVHIPLISPEFWMLSEQGTFFAASQGLLKLKSNVLGPINEGVLDSILLSALPKGIYYFYVMVTPTGKLDDYYLWATQPRQNNK